MPGAGARIRTLLVAVATAVATLFAVYAADADNAFGAPISRSGNWDRATAPLTTAVYVEPSGLSFNQVGSIGSAKARWVLAAAAAAVLALLSQWGARPFRARSGAAAGGAGVSPFSLRAPPYLRYA